MSTHHVIIGNGIAGARAAEWLAQHTDEADITVLTEEDRPLYNRILLKGHMKGKLPLGAAAIHDRSWYTERGIDLRLETSATDVDTAARQVFTTDEAMSYDRLLVATGGSPRPHPEDDGFRNVEYMWSYDDARRIKETARQIGSAVVIGGGLLGIDLAVAFAAHDVDTTYLIRGENWWRRGLDLAGAAIIHDRLEGMGVSLVTGVDTVQFENTGKRVTAVTADNTTHPCDTVAVAIGQHPNAAFIDVEKNDHGMIRVDDRLKTSAPDVYAAGNMVEYHSPIFQKAVNRGSWDNSAAMGETAAQNMTGEDTPFTYVDTYGVGHFTIPFIAVGDWSGEPVARRYGETVYRRLFFDGDRLTGAVMIGDTTGMEELRAIIRQKEHIEQRELLLDRSNWDALSTSQAP